jgi:hypothetical protein
MKNPLKILWMILIWAFTIVLSVILIKAKNEIINDNNSALYVGLWIFVSVVFLVANYQPYKEYKDGL